MKKLILASSIGSVAQDIVHRLSIPVGATLCFIVTASENEDCDMEWRHQDREAVVEAGFAVTDYTITGKSAAEIKEHLSRFDVLCMEGGDTFYLLRKVQETGCRDVLRELVEDGKLYIGSSAGSIVAGPDIYPLRHRDPIDEASRLDDYAGLGLTDLLILPHWGSEPMEEPYLKNRLEYSYGLDHKAVLLTDNQYLIVEGGSYRFIDVVRDAS